MHLMHHDLDIDTVICLAIIFTMSAIENITQVATYV